MTVLLFFFFRGSTTQTHKSMWDHNQCLLNALHKSFVFACTHTRGRTCAGGSELIKVPSLYLLNVVVQRDDPQRGGEVGAGRDGGAHRRGLAHVSLVGGELEIGSLIVLIQDLDNEVGVGRERVSVVLLGLERAKGNK